MIDTPIATYMATTIDVLPATRPTKAYLTGLFIDQARPHRMVDLSRESLVRAHIEAQRHADFERAQAIADWSLWLLSLYPAFVTGHREVVETLGQISYHRCYRLIPSWRVYEECADNLPSFTRRLHHSLENP